jgi:hypothetical protein
MQISNHRYSQLVPSVFPIAPSATPPLVDWSTAAVAHVVVPHGVVIPLVVIIPPVAPSWFWHVVNHLPHLLIEATLHALWAIASTAATLGASSRATVTPSTAANSHRQTLDNTIGRCLARSLPWVHSVIGREVSTNHERLHGCAVPSQFFRFVGHVGAVLAVVDSNLAEVAISAAVGFVQWIWPLAALANACSAADLSVVCLLQLVCVVLICTWIWERWWASTY